MNSLASISQTICNQQYTSNGEISRSSSLITSLAKRQLNNSEFFTPAKQLKVESPSISAISALETEPFQLSTSDGMCWKCVGREADPIGGDWLYEFEYVGHPKRIEGKVFPFPAGEPSENQFLQCDEFFGYTINKNGKQNLVLPSIISLEGRYEIQRNANPKMIKLKFFSCKEVLDHETFIDAWRENDIIVSSVLEMVHDLVTHAHAIIDIAKRYPTYYLKNKKVWVDRIVTRCNKVKAIRDNVGLETYSITPSELEFLKPHTQVLFAMISAIVDTQSSHPRPGDLVSEEEMLNCGVINDLWAQYFIDNFGHNRAFFNELWSVFNQEITLKEWKFTTLKLSIELQFWHLQTKGAVIYTDKCVGLYSPGVKRKLINWLSALAKTAEFRNNQKELSIKICKLLESSIFNLQYKLNECRNPGETLETSLGEMYREWQGKQPSNLTMKKSLVFHDGLERFLYAKLCGTGFHEYKEQLSLACKIELKDEFNLDLIITDPTYVETVKQASGIDVKDFMDPIVKSLKQYEAQVQKYLGLVGEGKADEASLALAKLDRIEIITENKST